MEQDKKWEPEKKKENDREKEKNWIDKAEEFMDAPHDALSRLKGSVVLA